MQSDKVSMNAMTEKKQINKIDHGDSVISGALESEHRDTVEPDLLSSFDVEK